MTPRNPSPDVVQDPVDLEMKKLKLKEQEKTFFRQKILKKLSILPSNPNPLIK